MAKLHYALAALIGTLTLTACPGDDGGGANDTSTSGTGGTGTVDGGPATNTMTNLTTSATSGSDTDPDSTGTDPTTSGTTNPPPTCDPECLRGQTCINGNCIGDAVTTGQMCDMWGEGNYSDCLVEGGGVDVSACGGPAICIVSGDPPDFGVCSINGCMDFCDCPEPPAGGTAECDAITMGGGNNCFLTCSGDATCPDDYYCFSNTLCVPGEDPNMGSPPYGPCGGGGQTCEEGLCSVDDPMDVTMGSCASPCMNANDCPAPPAGAEAPACGNFGMAGMFCVLPCGNDNCPDGMVCGPNSLCFWPSEVTPETGYGDCAPPIPTDGCLMTEDCETNMAATHSMCTVPGCVDATMDCPVAADGDAVVSCGDPLMGGADTCYLDCSMGETCPTGQECVDNSYCATPIGTPVFEEDFEGMMFPAMWNLVDVDMFVVNAMLGIMFPEAWILLDDSAGGGSQAAASTSWYEMPQTADDWMISPPITIGAAATLSWEARSETAMYPDGYEVYVSNVGNQIVDFTTMVLSVPAETETYSFHTVDLAAEGFADEDVWVAFRNVATDGWLLYVDNVAVSQ